MLTNFMYPYGSKFNNKTYQNRLFVGTRMPVAHYSFFKNFLNKNEWLKKSKDQLANVEINKNIKQIQEKIPSTDIIKKLSKKNSDAIDSVQKMGAKFGDILPNKQNIEKLKSTQIIPETIKNQTKRIPNPMNVVQSVSKLRRIAVRSGYAALGVLAIYGIMKGASICINAYKDLKDAVER